MDRASLEDVGGDALALLGAAGESRLPAALAVLAGVGWDGAESRGNPHLHLARCWPGRRGMLPSVRAVARGAWGDDHLASLRRSHSRLGQSREDHGGLLRRAPCLARI